MDAQPTRWPEAAESQPPDHEYPRAPGPAPVPNAPLVPVQLRLPVQMPTINRLFAMSPQGRRRIRQLLHEITACVVTGTQPNSILLAEYAAEASPSKKNKAARLKSRKAASGRKPPDASKFCLPQFDEPVVILVDHYRRNLADQGNLSIKAAVDAIVRLGILVDDSLPHVLEERHQQHQATRNETIITIRNVVPGDHLGISFHQQAINDPEVMMRLLKFW